LKLSKSKYSFMYVVDLFCFDNQLFSLILHKKRANNF
jgi:hypothetical protein